MHDVDALGEDQPLEPSRVRAQAERIDAVVGERVPRDPGDLQPVDERPAPARDDRAGAGLLQREGDVERRLRRPFVVGFGGEEKDGRAGKPPRGVQRDARFIAHAANSRWSPRQYPLALTPACGETDSGIAGKPDDRSADRCESGR
ncbi:MAG: hypothetical protein M5U33_08915 [Pseudorhodoplanes sp.]|nr:hypothetical protein [Pseudorhodoplanes sp.]